MTAPAHSKFSASASERWLRCPGSVVLSEGKPDTQTIYAARGTVAHSLLEAALISGGTHIDPLLHPDPVEQDGHTVIIDDELIDNVNWALGHITEITAGCDIVQSETKVNYSSWLGVPEEDGWGTADVIAVNAAQRELIVMDYKNGRKPVEAVDNTQMKLYAGGALLQFQGVLDFDTVRMVILQPEAGVPKEDAIPVEELKAWLTGRARSGAISVINAERFDDGPAEEFIGAFLHPGDHCQWCKAKPTCPRLREEVAETVGALIGGGPATPDEFDDMIVPTKQHLEPADAAWLAACLSKVDLIEDWCKAVRAEAERRLLAGEPVPGYKLVPGKKGARAWADADQAEALLKTFRLKQEEMYDFKLISPTTAEKLAKAETIGKRQWPKLQALITQSEGKAHVAPASDPRPAIQVQPIAEMFEPQAGDMV